MKKMLLSLVFGLSAISLFAQYPVSTTPGNKKSIIEEYTGIHCVYCPQGHLIAHNIMAANPGNAFLIAIHNGSFAAPSAGEPDYRTTWGPALEAQTGLVGYPAATINRHSFGHGQTSDNVNNGTNTAENRDVWSGDATTIMGQASYVNVGISAQVDYATRILTVRCQVYYTGNSTVTSNKLNIALLQNNVKGPQTGASGNPTMVTIDGQYLHQHMLRTLLTGQWGVSISNTNTASGTMKVDTTFTYTVPASFTSVTVNLAQLEVVAFVSEGNQEIISGNGCYVNPPSLDAGITSITGLPTIQCTTTGIAPTVVLKNYGTSTLTSCTINYSVDGGTTVSQPWSGSLATGSTANVVITNAITPTNGHHSLRCYTTMPNGSADLNDANDDISGVYNIFTLYSATPVSEEFTSTTFPPTNWVVDGTYWTRQAVSSFATGVGSARMEFFNAASGTINDLYVFGLNLASGTGHFLSFDHAYAQYTSENDKLQVQISTNCGTTWTNLFDKQGAALKTAPATTSAFTPTSTQWTHNVINLSAYDGQASVLVRFHATSAYGNNLYIDKILTGVGVGIDENLNNQISVFPNPATDIVNIVNAENSTVMLYDIFGKLISTNQVLNNNYSLNVAEYAKGTYILKITNDKGTISKKITILK
ncbi:MAG: Omp28-related outer membrane protein [Bacteroidota bacterium]